MQSTLYSLIQKAGAGTPSAVADSHLEDAINRVETGSYYELMLKAGAAPSAASPTLLANVAVKAPPTPDVVLEKAAPASKSRPAAAPKSAAGMSTKRTVEFVRSLLGLRGTATRAHSQHGHNIAEALALWRENPDGISLRSMSKRDAKSKQECAHVMKGIPRLKKKRCWEARLMSTSACNPCMLQSFSTPMPPRSVPPAVTIDSPSHGGVFRRHWMLC